ncbi:MAG: transcriptional regulator [Clostridia bacterium]|nr:transcriptional regulator [Clostridia bacterium]
MPKTSNQKTRILALYQILSAKTDEEHPLSANEIAQQLINLGYCCERKTVYSDIEELNNFGIEIIYTTEPKKGYFLVTRSFEESELSLLIDAVASADFITKKKSQALIKKLKDFLSDYSDLKTKTTPVIGGRNKGENEEIFYNIDTIRRAINYNKKITFSYFKHTLKSGHFIEKTSKQMQVSPYALVWQDDNYYLICNYEKYDNLMHLRLDRMKMVSLLKEDRRHFSEVSEYKDEFNVSHYVEKTFKMFSGVEADVRFKCRTENLEQVIDRFGDDIFIRSFDEEHFVFDTKIYFSDGFVSWLLSAGDGIELLAPKVLREKVESAASAILNKYK